MDQRKIRRIQDLQRLLLQAGFIISSQQLARNVAHRPKKLSTELLDALVDVLDCDISDLLVLEKPEQVSGETNGVIPMKRKRPAVF